MSRLYETNVDEKRWNIIETDNKNYHSYKLIDNEDGKIYFLNYIIGIEQIKDDEFLIYRRANYSDFEICRYKLHDSKIKQLFNKKFSDFYFLSDDKILFTYRKNTGSYSCDGIYSIKDNKMLEEAKWLNRTNIELYKDEKNKEKTTLYVEETFSSYKLGNPKLLFTVDSETLQPNSDCYSQLRNDFIKVNCKEDINNIKLEEQKYIQIIEENLYQQERKQLQKAKEKILIRKI